jgi:serine protease Do
VMDQLTHGGHVHRGMLGVGIQAVTSRLADALNLKGEGGVLVNSVQPGGPAEKAGIRAGDVILKFNGTPVNDPNDLRNRIAATPPGTNVTLTIVRDGREQQLSAHLSALPETKESASDVPQKQGSGAPEQLGLSVEPLTPDVAAQLGLRRGTQGLRVIEVDPAGPAAEAGIEPMDVIVEVNHTPVRSAAEVKAAIRLSGSRPVLLLVNRNGQNLFLTVAPTANGGEK